MRIPKKIKIGYHTYNVTYPFEFKDEDNLLGLHCGISGTIRVSKHKNDQILRETLLHEVFHGIDAVYLGDVLSEEVITKISKAWFQVIKDNNLYTDNLEKFAKTIKIGPFKYKILLDYEFNDTVTSLAGICDHEKLLIKIASKDRMDDYSPECMKAILCFTVFSAIKYCYCIEDETLEKIPDRVLGAGIYQVLRDNKLEELIKESM